MKQQTYSIRQFNREFPTDDACLEWLVQNRWPEGIPCARCQRITKHHKRHDRPAYSCDVCGTDVSPMAGTILEHSSTSLRSWFHAMFLMASTRCGISAAQLQREIGVTYKTAWRMFRQIRSMLTDDIVLEGSSVEADEMYVGGRRRGTPHGRPQADSHKVPVFGMVERKGRVIAKVVPNVQARTILPIVREKVMPTSTIYTDEFWPYQHLSKMGYEHRQIQHGTKVYVMGDVHTNTIEGFWSLVKRGISGVNHSVSRRYLQGYLNEYAFRYNRRSQKQPMFQAFLAQVVKAGG